MEKTSISIGGMIKWLLHNWIVIVCITLAAAIAVTGFYSLKFSREKTHMKATVSVSGRLMVKVDDGSMNALFGSFSTAAFNLITDDSVRRNAAELFAGQYVDDAGFAATFYSGIAFDNPCNGIIMYSFTADADKKAEAETAIDCLVESVNAATSGFPDELSLIHDKDSIVKGNSSPVRSLPAYMIRSKKKIAAACIGAFAAVCAVYVFIYLLMTRVRCAADIEARYDVKILGTVPKGSDKHGSYKSLLIKLNHVSEGRLHTLVGASDRVPKKLYDALEGENAVVLVYDESAENTSETVKDAGIYYVKPDFDAASLDFDTVIAYVVRSKDTSFALSVLERMPDCIFVETQYKSCFADIESNLRDMQSIGKKVKGIVLEEN